MRNPLTIIGAVALLAACAFGGQAVTITGSARFHYIFLGDD